MRQPELIIGLIIIILILSGVSIYFIYKYNYQNRTVEVFSQINTPLRRENLVITLYNIHHGVGIDGRLDLDRIARVLKKNRLRYNRP